MNEPLVFESWDEWADNPPPPMSFKAQDKAFGTSFTIIADADDHFPISYKPELSQPEKQIYAEDFKQKSWKIGWSKAALDDQHSSVQRWGMMAMAACVLVMTFVIVMLVLPQVELFDRTPDEPVVAQAEAQQHQIVEVQPGVCMAYVPALRSIEVVECPVASSNSP